MSKRGSTTLTQALSRSIRMVVLNPEAMDSGFHGHVVTAELEFLLIILVTLYLENCRRQTDNFMAKEEQQ